LTLRKSLTAKWCPQPCHSYPNGPTQPRGELRRTKGKRLDSCVRNRQGLILGSWGTVPFRSLSCQHSIYPAYQVSRYHSQILICAIRSNAPPKRTKSSELIKVSLSGQEDSCLWHNMTCSTLAYPYEPIRTSNFISRTSFVKSAFHKNENDSPYPSRQD
jgi:hypothetical protein